MNKILAVIKRWLSTLTQHPLQWAIYLLCLVFFLHADLFAGLIFFIFTQVIRYLFIRRSEVAFRRSLIGLVAVLGIVSFVAALGLPSYRSTRDSIIIPARSIREGGFSAKPGDFELSYDLMTTSGNAQQEIDAQAHYLTYLGMDGYFLNPDGTLNATDNTDLLLHTHLTDTRGMFLVQNYVPTFSGGSFSEQYAHQVLFDPRKTDTLVKALSAQAIGQHWDGVILDFEQLTDADFAKYAALVERVRAELPSTIQVGVDMSVQFNQPSKVWAAGLKRIGQAADFVNLMTYDLNVPTLAPGPIGPLNWVSQMVHREETWISRTKLKIGSGDYAYVWGPLAKKIGSVQPPQAALTYARSNGMTLTWNAAVGEWHATSTDGSQMWIQDKQSVMARIKLAKTLRVRGLNVWELSRSQPLAGISKGVTVYRPYVEGRFSRPVSMVNARGLVALTFDDGPDPTWTPKILSVLEKNHVPATFFVVGQQAVNHPDLISRAIHDGDVIGNHTYTHPDLASLPQWMAKLEIGAGSWVIKGITGMTPLLFRSPYGIADSIKHANATGSVDLTQQMGLQEIGWNTDTFDWSRPGVARILQNASKAPNAEPIILLHDGGGNRAQTVAALPLIIRHYRQLGYRFTTVDHLDGSSGTPYLVQKETFWSLADSLGSIAGFKLWLASRDILTTILILMAGISLLRLSGGWALAARYLRRTRRRKEPNSQTRISILIPAHNEQETIEKTLRSVSEVDWQNLEIIVAENGSTDETVARAQQFALTRDNVRVLQCEARGKAAALNEAFQQTDGQIIVVLDADTVISSNFCRAVARHFANERVGAVAGNVKVGNRRNLLTRLQALEYIISLSLDRASQAEIGIVSVVPGAAGAFRREAIVATGGWPERTLVEDTDLTVQLHRAGWTIDYEPEAISLTESPETVGEIVKQRSRWIYGTTQVIAVNIQSVFSISEGRLGVLGLPWLLVTQVALPVLGPLVDLYLLSQILLGQSLIALAALALSLLLESLVTVWALRQAGERLTLLWGVLGLRLIWRPLMLWVAIVSMSRYIRGKSVSWRKLIRKNTVDVTGA